MSITQPDDNATLQGSADLNVTYVSSSDQLIVRVDIWIDDGRMISYKLKEPVQKGKTQFRLHTEEVADGERRLQVQVFDAAGHAGQAQIKVHVRNGAPPTPAPKVSPSGPDLIPPAVSVRQPQNAARVSGRMQVTVEATDDTKVLCVLLFVDDEWAAIQNYAPYNFDVQTTKLPDGVHTVYACAFDAAQNKGESAKAYFVVDNARATTPSAASSLLESTPDSRGPESVMIEGRGPEMPETAAGPASEAAATRARRPAPELAADGKPLPATERMAFAPKLVMPHGAGAASSPSPAVTTRAALHVGQAAADAVGTPQRTRVALLGPKTSQPHVPPSAARPPVVSAADARMPARSSAAAYTPARSRTPSGQVASVPFLPPSEAREPVSSYSGLNSVPALARPNASAPGRIMVASGHVASQPRAPGPPTVRTDRGERYAMLPRNVVTVAAPKRDTAATSSGQRVSSPRESLLEAKHVIHLGGRSVPVMFDNELLKLRTLPMERTGVAVGPIREIFEHTGGIVHWFPVDKRVIACNDNTTVELRIGHGEAKVDAETVWLELAPFIENGRTMVPFAFIKRVLDVTVKYESKSGRIQITSNKF